MNATQLPTDHAFEPDIDVVTGDHSRWCKFCGEAAAHHRDPTMLDIVRTMSESLTESGVAIALGSHHRDLSPDHPLVAECWSVEGRRKVYAWAYSLGEMIAT